MGFSPINSTVAYFSMEIALETAIPTYSGGLGVLAGDTLRSAADLAVPVVGITLVHRKGYFRQHLDKGGNQTESPAAWQPDGRKSFELDESDLEETRRRCVFTTHTPVPAGHDRFPAEMVRSVLGSEQVSLLEAAQCMDAGALNMTHLALRLSRFVNGVA